MPKKLGLARKLVDGLMSGGIVGGVMDIATGWIENKGERAAAREALDENKLEAQIRELLLRGDLEKTFRECLTKENLAQMEINLADAKSGKWYQAGWRPACGWAGFGALVYSSFGYSMFTWISHWAGDTTVVPVEPDTAFIQIILVGMLGLRGGEKFVDKREDKKHAIEMMRLQLESDRLEREAV